MPPDRPPGSSVSIRRLRDVLLYATLLVPFAAALQQPPHDAYPSQPADLDAAATVQVVLDVARGRYDEHSGELLDAPALAGSGSPVQPTG